MTKKIIVAVTGASGSIYASDLIQKLIKLTNSEIAVIRSANAMMVWQHELETGWPFGDQIQYFDNKDFMAPFASGSSAWDAMVIIPASMGTIGRIAHGISDGLITRAADVMLKEKKHVIICPRETPWNLIHIENLKLLHLAGALIMPTSPSFYSKPKDIQALIGTVSDRIIDHLKIEHTSFRWGKK
ncbi:MAG: UbiX family flavin prenyltransferase [Bacteroidales bacterium]|nr:UbiX family flavin prenyltransferase [Bacteroidales bacterium]